MLLAFDVGNTNIVCGVYKDRKLIRHWRVATDTLQTADGYAALLGNLFQLTGLSFKEVEDIIISTVVPPIIPILETMSQRYFHTKPILVGPGIKTGLNILYDNPKELGADRIVNAVAAVDEYKCPLIIIDMGTRHRRLCVLDTKGNVIIPGRCCRTGHRDLQLPALFQRASKLPRIELVKTPSIICRNTVSAMQAGIYYGFVGQIDEIVNRIKEELNEKNVKVIATGGLATLIAKSSKTIDIVDPMLTLTWGFLSCMKKIKRAKKREA